MTPTAAFSRILSAKLPLNTRLRQRLPTSGRRQYGRWRASNWRTTTLRHDERVIDACGLPAAVTIDSEWSRTSGSTCESGESAAGLQSQHAEAQQQPSASAARPQAALGEQSQRPQLNALVLRAPLRHERAQETQVANQDQLHQRTPSTLVPPHTVPPARP